MNNNNKNDKFKKKKFHSTPHVDLPVLLRRRCLQCIFDVQPVCGPPHVILSGECLSPSTGCNPHDRSAFDFPRTETS